MKRKNGQAILEYILTVVMVAVIVAVLIRNINFTTYGLWTGLARQVAAPCPPPNCTTDPGPDF